MQRCHIQTPTVVERRECVEKIGGFDEQLRVAEDYMHWIRIALEGWAVGYLDEPLAKYRWRAGSLMSSKRRVLEEHARMFGMLLARHQASHALSDEAKAIMHDRFVAAERELAYLDQLEGHRESARRRLIELIRRSPLKIEFYVELAKAYLRRG
jgi:hypothetical protein